MDGLAERIREARRRQGWTQEQLADAVGVTRSAVAQWETGRSGQLTANLSRISKVLETSLAKLVGSESDGDSAQAVPTRDQQRPMLHPQSAEPSGDLGDELALLRLYRECSPEDQRLLLLTARRLSQKSDDG